MASKSHSGHRVLRAVATLAMERRGAELAPACTNPRCSALSSSARANSPSGVARGSSVASPCRSEATVPSAGKALSLLPELVVSTRGMTIQNFNCECHRSSTHGLTYRDPRSVSRATRGFTMCVMSRPGDENQRAAFDSRVREIRLLPADEAFTAAGQLVEIQAAFRAQAADVRAEQALRVWNSEPMTMAELGRRLGGVSKQRADRLLKRGREVAARQSTAPLPEAIVAAIVTSRRGVLVTQRLDGIPPWGFVTGKIEPGESPADAAVREVKEETGLEVQHGEIIGQRLHPVTQRLVIYMTARLAKGASSEIFIGDRTELSAVQWVSLAEAASLLPDMYEPVRKYLDRVVRGPR